MCLIFLTCSLFLFVYVLHFIGCSSIEIPLYWFDPWPAFYHYLLCIHRFLAKSHVHTWIFGHKSCIHPGFWPKSVYACNFLAKSRVYAQLFFKQLRTSSLLVSLMLWEVLGWVVSVVGSSLGLMLSVGCFFCDQRPFFHIFLFESSFSHLSFLFFQLVHYSFCLGVLLGLSFILAAETENFR